MKAVKRFNLCTLNWLDREKGNVVLYFGKPALPLQERLQKQLSFKTAATSRRNSPFASSRPLENVFLNFQKTKN